MTTAPAKLLESTPDYQRLCGDDGTELVRIVATGQTYATGWLPRPAAVEAFKRDQRRRYLPVTFEEAAPTLLSLYGGTDDPVFYWDAEVKQFGRVLGSWDQGQVGSCVGFGYGRAVQDVLLNEIHFGGEPERWPDAEIAPEVVYGFSRVEVGGGGISGDGSVGAWAAKAVRDYGVLIRKAYPGLDLTRYNEAQCRQLGDRGVPDSLEPESKLHIITAVAQITTEDGLWAALGARKGVPPCSNLGFATTRDADGFCAQQGTWNHCMEFVGRFVHPRHGRCIVWRNSWNGYLRGPDQVQYVKADGSTGTFTLPEGCFCTKLLIGARAVQQDDTHGLAGFKGWDAPTPPGPTPPTPPGPMASQRTLVSMWIDMPSTAPGTTIRTAPGSDVVATAKIVGPVPTSGADPAFMDEPAGAAFPWDAVMRAIPWALVLRYFWLILPIVMEGWKAGKTVSQIIAEIMAVLMPFRGKTEV